MAIDLTSHTNAGARITVAQLTDYAEAQRVVDTLSDGGFPVEHVAIVGHDLTLVEVVTGRLTTGRAAAMGAATGAWFGLLFGLLVSIFTVGSTWLGLVLGGLVIGALWGAVWGGFGHAATGGRRDFASRSGLDAGRFEVVVDPAHADAARRLLGATA